MVIMTLTAKSYADLEPLEVLVKRLGIGVDVERDGKRAAAMRTFRDFADISQDAAIKAGIASEEAINDIITKAIKEVRKKTKEEKNVKKERSKKCA
jgi:hypothetical protein